MHQSVASKQCIALKPKFSADLIEAEKILLSSESRKTVLSGSLYLSLIPLLDGKMTEKQIVMELSERFAEPEIYYALASLERQGFTYIFSNSACRHEAAFWQSLGYTDSLDQEKSQSEFSVSVRDFTRDNHEEKIFKEALNSLKINLVEDESAELIVVLVSDYLDPAVSAWSKRARDLNKPWFIASTEGSSLWIGPVFSPDKPGCSDCLQYQLRMNKNAYVSADSSCIIPNQLASLKTTRVLGLNLLALEVARCLRSKQTHQLNDKIMIFDFQSYESRLHPVLGRSECRFCRHHFKSDEQRRSTRVNLISRRRAQFDDGGYRACHPEETVKRLEKFASPISGLYPDISRISIQEQIFVYSMSEFGPVIENEYSRLSAAGKGASDFQAKASCLAEAIERMSCVYRTSDKPLRNATYLQVREQAVHPDRLSLLSEKQIKEIDSPTRIETLAEDLSIGWTENWSLTNQALRLLPAAYCYFAYPIECRKPYLRADSNGCASGNTLEEAVLQGFLEIIERDAISMWWYCRPKLPAIDLSSFNERFFEEMARVYKQLERSLVLIDLRNDVGIPVVIACSWSLSDGKGLLLGAGAHLDTRVAASRAISEVSQVLPYCLRASNVSSETSSPACRSRAQKKHLDKWLASESIESQSFMEPDRSARRAAKDMPNYSSDDLLANIQVCQKAVEKLGLEVLVMNLTRPDYKFPVARVTVPGMRNLRGLASGRLYEVPAKLGWSKAVLSEDELNPYPFLW